jgi:NADH-quinone oxidoreductase subunit J
MVAQNIAFGIIAAVIVVSALRVVTTRNIVHAALYLVVVLAGVAALYFLLVAEFVGVTQILVYIGAIVVLFLFGIMLTRAPLGGDTELDSEQRWMAGLVAVLLLAVMSYALIDGFEDVELPEERAVQTTADVSDSIFSTYLVPFEAVSVLLLAALVGSIVVARKD